MQHGCKILRVGARSPEDSAIKAAAGAIQKGGVVVFPTTCLYGLGADAFIPQSVEAVFKIKKRAPDHPLLVLIHKDRDLKRLVRIVSEKAGRLMDVFWPGNITLIMEAVSGLPPGLTGGSGKIGVRVPKSPVAAALVSACGGPVTGTSANLSGSPGASTLYDIDTDVLKNVDLVLDAGRLKGGKGSTVVDLTCDPPVMLREGTVSKTAFFNTFTNG